jgi:replicative DNA helicase
MSSFGKSFLSAVLAEKSVSNFVGLGNISHLFQGTETEVANFISGFVKQHAQLPAPETVQLHTGEALAPMPEPSSYYLDLLEARHVEREVKKALHGANEKLKSQDPFGAKDLLRSSIMSLTAQSMGKQIADFRHSYDLIISTFAQQMTKESTGSFMFGWPYLDELSGGLGIGDMASMVGRPQKGKTWALLYAALYGWKQAGEATVAAVKAGKDPLPPKIGSRLFVSMEMASLPIQQRLAAFVAQVEPIKLKKGALSSIGVTNMKNGLTRIQHYGSPFYVVDGNLTATVEDIWALARQLDVEAILIDGGYLIKHPTERDRFRRVAENAELIKKELCPLAPTIVSWQFARSATKKKKGEKADLDDIGYTDAIAQVSSLVLGLLEKDTIETLKQRSIEILKGRNGETGSFNTAWEFDKMNFTQIIETPVKEFQFL